jgi:hypothetical protein
VIQPSVTTAVEKTAAPCVLKHLQSGPINETSQGLAWPEPSEEAASELAWTRRHPEDLRKRWDGPDPNTRLFARTSGRRFESCTAHRVLGPGILQSRRRRSSWSLRGVNLRIGDAADRPRVSPSHSNGVVA